MMEKALKVILFVLLFSLSQSYAKSLAQNESQYVEKERELLNCLSKEKGITFFRSLWESSNSQSLNNYIDLIEQKLLKKECDQELLRNELEELADQSLLIKKELGVAATVYSEKKVVDSLFKRRISDTKLLERDDSLARCDLSNTFSKKDLVNRELWHDVYLKKGHTCTTKMFKKAKGQIDSNKAFQEKFNITTRDQVYTQDFSQELLKGRNIAIVPSLAYEKVYMLFLPVVGERFAKTFNKNPDHYLTVTMLANILKSFGAKNVKVIHRSTVMPLKDQAELTFKGLEEFGKEVGDYDVISQSAGSQVVNYILKNISKTKENLPKGMSSWINVGGTPRGSAIAEYKSAFDFYLTEHLLGQIKTLNMINPVTVFSLKGLTALTDKVRPSDIDRLVQSAHEGIKLENIQDLSFKNPATEFSEDELKPGSATYELPIVNVTAVVEDLDDLTPSQDPVIPLQAMYGVSEGSSLLVDAGIDSKKSIHLFLEGDHLSFYANEERDKIAALYLQIYKTLIDGNFYKKND